MEDFREWTNWLFYRGGIGVKGEESWEAWWDSELVIQNFFTFLCFSFFYINFKCSARYICVVQLYGISNLGPSSLFLIFILSVSEKVKICIV